MKKIYILFVFIVSFSAMAVWAFDDKETHPRLTKVAIRKSQSLGGTYLKDYLAIGKNDTPIAQNGKSIIELLQGGSIEEDHPLCRASNHFHNPLKAPWNNSGMDDPVWFIDAWCAFGDYPTGKLTSAVHWATGFTSPTAHNLSAGMGHREFLLQS